MSFCCRAQLTGPFIIIQLVKHDHRRTVATFIREQIEALEDDEEDAPEDLEAGVLSNVDIGSKLKVVSYSALEQAESGDPAFHRFRLKFGDFISQHTGINYRVEKG